MRALVAGSVLALVGLACATSPLGRSQLIMFPDSEVEQMGLAAYSQLKRETPISRDAATSRYVRCVADAITAELRDPGVDAVFAVPVSAAYRGTAWETTLFQEDSANAFALPGGKIGVHTGLLRVATNQHQLATVLGHEVAHVIARHSNERVSQAAGAQLGLVSLASVLGAIGNPASPNHAMMMSALGLGSDLAQRKFGRDHESEADVIGIKLMALAGFDPMESVALWKNMMRAGGVAPPEFLSTHPSHETRIAGLYEEMAGALELRERAKARGRNPRCDS